MHTQQPLSFCLKLNYNKRPTEGTAYIVKACDLFFPGHVCMYVLVYFVILVGK